MSLLGDWHHDKQGLSRAVVGQSITACVFRQKHPKGTRYKVQVSLDKHGITADTDTHRDTLVEAIILADERLTDLAHRAAHSTG